MSDQRYALIITSAILLGFFVILVPFFSANAQSILYEQSVQSTVSGVISYGSDSVFQDISCDDVNGIVTSVEILLDPSGSTNTDYNLRTSFDGGTLNNASQLTTNASLHSETYVLGEIYNGSTTSFGACGTGDGYLTYTLDLNSNNGITFTTRGSSADVYPYSSCSGSDCASIDDLYIILRGTPYPIALPDSSFEALSETATSSYESVVGFPLASTTEFTNNVFTTYISLPLLFLDQEADNLVSYTIILLVVAFAFGAFHFYKT